MQTITFQKNLSIKKNKFTDITDFFAYAVKNKIIDLPTEVGKLSSNEINQEILEQGEKALKIPKNKLLNI